MSTLWKVLSGLILFTVVMHMTNEDKRAADGERGTWGSPCRGVMTLDMLALVVGEVQTYAAHDLLASSSWFHNQRKKGKTGFKTWFPWSKTDFRTTVYPAVMQPDVMKILP
jgi:hypothetical protein